MGDGKRLTFTGELSSSRVGRLVPWKGVPWHDCSCSRSLPLSVMALRCTALRDFTSYEAKPIGLASQKSSDSRPADIAYSRSLKVVADMEREVERRRIGYNRFQRAGHPIASVPIAQLTAEEKERYGLG